ncbi:MAG: CDP-diacylglycerol--glycerol-3-phosphate 3-phosphatidyltransferase [Puniceicoccales bacterium]|jgi:CDP-diacylglycerol--glycerol-3-phosphate 3-phosphatidyltransferase|nr:CDP-diacylglycerol--glycerol-3-phosphate 3-phosphatidyltransferase [Puniceicoccales bacterium]
MNAANMITISRFPLLFVVAALLYAPFPGSRSAAFILYLLTGFSDWADGYVARRCAMVSNFGKFMDALSDKILTLGLFILFLTIGVLPKPFLFAVLVILGREFTITGLRLVAASRNVVIAAERSGKIKTIFQMVSIGALICAQAIRYDMHSMAHSGEFALAMWYFGIVLFAIAFYCAISSAIRYLVRYHSVFDGDGGSLGE